MLKNLINTRTLHLLSLIGIIGVIMIAAFAFIEGDAAYIKLINGKTYELGKCFYREKFGIVCPSCGLTRSFIAIESFDFIKSVYYNKIGFLVYLLMIFTMIFNILGLLKIKAAVVLGKFIAIYGFIVCILLVLIWLYKFIG